MYKTALQSSQEQNVLFKISKNAILTFDSMKLTFVCNV